MRLLSQQGALAGLRFAGDPMWIAVLEKGLIAT